MALAWLARMVPVHRPWRSGPRRKACRGSPAAVLASPHSPRSRPARQGSRAAAGRRLDAALAAGRARACCRARSRSCAAWVPTRAAWAPARSRPSEAAPGRAGPRRRPGRATLQVRRRDAPRQGREAHEAASHSPHAPGGAPCPERRCPGWLRQSPGAQRRLTLRAQRSATSRVPPYLLGRRAGPVRRIRARGLDA